MTTQPETAVGSEAPQAEPTDATQFFEDMAREEFGIKEEEEQPAEGEETPTEEAEDEPTLEEEADDLPPIDAPVSWDADAKEVFKALPRDAQEIVAKRESERERFVQQKSQEATRARTEAEQEAIRQLAQIEQGYSQHYQQMAEQLTAQPPNPALLQHDPQAFYAQEYAYRQATAQQQELQQRAAQHAQQAQAREQQAEQARLAAERQVIVENFPEYADPTTGPELQRKLSAVAKRIGYPDELIGQARAQDIIAMRNVAEAFDKADKYDGLMKQKMAKVRQAKGLPKVATPGVASSPDQLRARSAEAAFETARTSKNRDVAGAAFLDLAIKKGWTS